MKEQVFREIENCVKCGSCKALCPTFALDHEEPMSARGRVVLLRGLERGDLSPSELLNERVFSCLLCGMCEATCPVGIRITEAMYQGRERLGPTYRRRRLLRRLAKFALTRPGLSYRAARTLKGMLPYLQRKGRLPFRISLPREPLRKGLKIYKPRDKATGRVAMFAGCSVNFLFPHLGESLVHLLVNAGYEVVLPAGEVCCGAPLRAGGFEKEAAGLAWRNMEVFGRLKAEAVLSLCPTCTLALRHHYPYLVGQGIAGAMDATEFLARKSDVVFRDYRPRGSEGPVAYHDPCHLYYGLGVREEPRELIRRMGHEVTANGGANCCGFSLAFSHERISTGLLDERHASYRESGVLITACPGCMLQLGRRHQNVVHIVQALDEALHPEEY